jgi:hypothetical protein
MRIPQIVRNPNRAPSSITTVKVDKIPQCTYEADVDMDEQKSVDRYVKALKAFIRGTGEYRRLMTFLKYNRNMNKCYYLPKVVSNRGDHITIEEHHVGGTITEIIETVLRKRVKEFEPIDFNSIAEEVMLAHYRGMISIVPLSSTMHQLIHAEDTKLFIPIHDAEFGDSHLFYEEYKEYMHKSTRNKFEKYFLLSEAFNSIDEILPDYIDINILYFEQEGVEIPRWDKMLEILDEVA